MSKLYTQYFLNPIVDLIIKNPILNALESFTLSIIEVVVLLCNDVSVLGTIVFMSITACVFYNLKNINSNVKK